MIILCDTSVINEGMGLQMAGPHSMPLHFGVKSQKGAISPIRVSKVTGRHHEQHHDYFNLSDEQGIPNQRCVPRCQCHEVSVMYIAATLADRGVRYPCPTRHVV